MKRVLCSVFLVLALAAGSAVAGTAYVDASQATGSHDGSSWANAYSNLQNAIDSSSDPTDLWVAEGLYDNSHMKAHEGTVCFVAKDGVVLYGGFTNNGTWATRDWQTHETVLDGEATSYHVVIGHWDAGLNGFVVSNGNAVGGAVQGWHDYGGGVYGQGMDIANCRFVDNNATDYGAAVYDYSTPVISNCVFLDGTCSDRGGALYLSGNATVLSCRFTNNSANSYGGAIFINGGVSPGITNCTFMENSSANGGAISDAGDGGIDTCTFTSNTVTGSGAALRLGGNQTVTDCTFSYNSADSAGGGVYVLSGAPSFSYCTFHGNSGSSGGAIRNEGASTIVDCVMRTNTASGSGGGYYGYSASAMTSTVRNCTFIDNQSGTTGAGLYHRAGTPIVEDCTFAGNASSDGAAGAYFYQALDGVMQDCIFAANDASPDSGASGLRDCNGSSRIENCTHAGNKGKHGIGYIGLCNPGSTDVFLGYRNCRFIGNYATSGNAGAGIYFYGGTGTIENCTFSGGYLYNGLIRLYQPAWARIRNCIFWDNSGVGVIKNTPATVDGEISYTCLEGGLGSAVTDNPLVDGGGNISSDPLFAGAVATGTWSQVGVYDPMVGQTALEDTGAGWTVDQFADMTVNPDVNESTTALKYLQYLVSSNDADTIWVWGNCAALALNGDTYAINDFHLKSLYGRYTELGWVSDSVQSPCIDAGDPTSSYDGEPQPHGWQLNMGAYGNTAEASKSQPKGSMFLIR